ncbi:MAG: 2,3-bisphosphoglycerate-independent phosphoglycerate mutase [Pseudomonadales bacterium]
MQQAPKPIVLVILDGWGHSETSASNAINAAQTPVWDTLWENSPRTLLNASEESAGLPNGQMGNSEVGHMIMGAGRIIAQNSTRIDGAIADGSFFKNPILCSAIDRANAAGGDVHIQGLLSDGGVHSHEHQIHAMVELAAQRGANNIYVHAFLDGRDTPPRSAADSLRKMADKLKDTGRGKIASMMGRYFAMDRDNRWDRVQLAYDTMTQGKAIFRADHALKGLEQAYARGEDDEFVQTTILHSEGEEPSVIKNGDAVICMNHRADRSRELTRAFVDTSFDSFVRSVRPILSEFVMLSEYAKDLDASCAFPTTQPKQVLGEYISGLGKSQLRMAETEKYGHVTFFFNGGSEEPFPHEERVLVQSPDVPTYDLKPEMSAHQLTDELVKAIESKRFDLIVCNYANGDMVGHTGNFGAAIKAVETLDECLARIVTAIGNAHGECIITADHGNVEQMSDETSGQPHTAHTCELVPFVLIGERHCMVDPREGGLADIAPTLLHLMGLEQPEEMTGESLVRFL